jgi:hypothetical protein
MTDDIKPIRSADGCDTDSGMCASDYAGLSKALLTSPIMLWAYAVSLVILSLCLSTLILGIFYLSFRHPDQFQAWLLVLGSPAALLIIAHLPNLVRLLKNKNGK